MTSAGSAALRRPRPGPEKSAFDAWQLDGPSVALAILEGARVPPRDRADFLRHVIGLPDDAIAEYLTSR